ncbi:MAG: DUF4912 domain-containing protein [Elusimicrobiota bacterium]
MSEKAPTSGMTTAVYPINEKTFVDRGGDLPSSYGDNQIVIMPRDPLWMYSYWEINDKKIAQVKLKHGENIFEQTATVLRVHDVTGITFNGTNSHNFFDVSARLEVRNWYIQVLNPGRSYCVELGLRKPNGEFILLARSNIITLPAGKVSEKVDEQWAMIQADFDKLYSLSGADRIGIGSGEISKLLAKRWEMFQSTSSWPTSGGISSMGAVRPIAEDFWLLADAEVIIHGATEPNAQLTLQGKPIQLNSDGTFSARFYLPNSILNFPIRAVSASGSQQREITITVERKTK